MSDLKGKMGQHDGREAGVILWDGLSSRYGVWKLTPVKSKFGNLWIGKHEGKQPETSHAKKLRKKHMHFASGMISEPRRCIGDPH